jgi:hypothetical protein
MHVKKKKERERERERKKKKEIYICIRVQIFILQISDRKLECLKSIHVKGQHKKKHIFRCNSKELDNNLHDTM